MLLRALENVKLFVGNEVIVRVYEAIIYLTIIFCFTSATETWPNTVRLHAGG